MANQVWETGDAYEAYVGRWSRVVAAHFVGWLRVPGGSRWLDVGCGTGALTAAIQTGAAPALVAGIDRSLGFLTSRTKPSPAQPSPTQAGPAQTSPAQPSPAQPGPPQPSHAPACVAVGDAAALPIASDSFDAVVSGLTLNFVPHPERAIAEFTRIARPGGVVASYVWDYAAGMRMMRYFWDAAADIDPAAADRDESRRFPLCDEKGLTGAWADAGLNGVATRRIEIPTVFAGFDEFWRPFLGGQGSAPAYLAQLPGEHREAIRELLLARLGDRTIMLTAAAWAVRGFKDV